MARLTRTEAYLVLTLLPRIGPVRVRRLVESLGGPERVLDATLDRLVSVSGIGAEIAETLRDWENRTDLATEKRRIAEHGIDLLTIEESGYPERLRAIHDPPFLLFLKGKILPRDDLAVAVVGSRRATHYGREAARKLSFQLAHAGVTIVSGLARGIDTAAHEAAVAAGGRTIAVLGSGIGNLYPAENAALAERIAENGAVISEFPVLYVPDKQSFPLRNRIVSGLSQGILVAEAPARSGSLITASQALEQGRGVYAVPGPIDRPTSAGCNRLIQEGAKLVLDAGDILDELDGAAAAPELPGLDAPRRAETLDETERRVFAALESAETPIDTIAEGAGLPIAVVSATLLRLEMKRVVKQLPGKYFVKLI